MSDRRDILAARATLLQAIAYGLVCHVAFALGVGTMIVAMFYGMSASLGRLSAPWSIVADCILLLQFPLLHSLLLSPIGVSVLKRLAPRPVSAPLSTTTYVIVASLQVFLLFAFWAPSGVVWWRADGITLGLLTALYAGAWLLLLKAIADAGLALQTGFLGWWAVAHQRRPVFPPMPTDGLFRLMRQPIYVAFALTLWTVPTWTPDQLILAFVLTGYCLAGPLLKERRFRKRFGEAFATYAARVPYWLPWPRPPAQRNDLSIYEGMSDWWDGRTRWVRTLRNLVPVRLQYFQPLVDGWRGRRVLDVGCGGGFMAEAMTVDGAIVVGIDPSPTAVAAATRHAKLNRLAIDYRVARGEDLPFADASFDIVVCVDVLEHVRDPATVVAEVGRVLKPGGLFLFDTINRTPVAWLVMIGIAEMLLRLVPRGTHDPALFIRPAELAVMLRRFGFKAEGFAGMGPGAIDRRLDVRFRRWPTTAIQYLGHAVRSA